MQIGFQSLSKQPFKMRSKSFFFILILCLRLYAGDKNVQYAYVAVPVTDLLGKPLSLEYPGEDLEPYYKNIPFSGSANSCLRLHQALFNERVTVLAETEQEAKIKISNFYYLLEGDKTPQTVFWTLKKNLITTKQLNGKKVNLSRFPPPISYHYNNLDGVNKNTATLKKPFYDPVTKATYSIGTRFITAASSQEDSFFIKVYVFDKNRLNFRITKIPRYSCVKTTYKNNDDKVKMFVRLLRRWSNQDKGFIPYVLGGYSWTESCQKDHYSHIKDTKTSQGGHYFSRKEWGCNPKVGLDCAGMIARATQICGIPYYFKNTTTLVKQLKPIGAHDHLKEGDLIWVPGHVLVVSSLKNNTVIESRGYTSGHGKMQEVPLNKAFKEMNTFKDLKAAFLQEKPIEHLHKNGSGYQIYTKFKLLKLDSVWEHNPYSKTYAKRA